MQAPSACNLKKETNMSNFFDNQANTYDFFELEKNHKKRTLAQLSVDELKDQLSKKKAILASYNDLSVDQMQLFKDEIKQLVWTIGRIKHFIKRSNPVEQVDYISEIADKDNEIKKRGLIIEQLNFKISNLKHELKKLSESEANNISSKNNQIKRLGLQIEDMKEKYAEKIKNVNYSKSRNEEIYNVFKGLVKDTYGMPAYMELIEEADRIASKILEK